MGWRGGWKIGVGGVEWGWRIGEGGMEGRLGGGNMREEWDGVGESRVE